MIKLLAFLLAVIAFLVAGVDASAQNYYGGAFGQPGVTQQGWPNQNYGPPPVQMPGRFNTWPQTQQQQWPTYVPQHTTTCQRVFNTIQCY